jgi:NADPH:quinone reductase-like Zn-dependent oxidoreductase
MPRAVRFDSYGGVDVLYVADVAVPGPPPGEVVVRVHAAGTNPGEAAIRSGALHDRFPATFPSGQGSDLAGVVDRVGDGVERWSPGDEVLGWTDRRASHAEQVTVPADQLTPKPDAVPFEVAGALYVAGSAAVAGVRAVEPGEDETVLVSGAAGGVGSITVQLARRRGARVLGVASQHNHDWLRSLGALPLGYGDELEDAVRTLAPDGVDAVIDTFGGGYVALGRRLGVPPGRINTIADVAAVQAEGVHGAGTSAAGSVETLSELARLVADGSLEVPVAATYPLEQVREAFTELERRHTHGKIVLLPAVNTV